MTTIKNILILLLVFFVLKIQGQQILGPNLVQNPSFENYSSCPIMSNQLSLALHWWGLSSDYFNSCAPQGWSSVPLNTYGFQYAHTGVAYAAFIIYYHNAIMANNMTYTEPIKNELSQSLKMKSHYCINYYISLSDYTLNYAQVANYPILFDSIGAMFTVNQAPDNDSIIVCDTCPKFAYSIAKVDTTNWLKITGSIIANGGEKYMTIGKFNIMNWLNGAYCEFYVYIDDVSVCECSFEFSLGRDTTLCEGETLMLNPNMPNAIYTWQDSSHASTYKVTKPGTYWVRAYFPDYGITTSSSINITSSGDCLTIPNIFTPNNDNINDYFVIQNSEGWDIDLQVYSRWGNKIFQDKNYKNNWDGKDLAEGVYYYIIKATNQSSGYEKNYHGSVSILR